MRSVGSGCVECGHRPVPVPDDEQLVVEEVDAVRGDEDRRRVLAKILDRDVRSIALDLDDHVGEGDGVAIVAGEGEPGVVGREADVFDPPQSAKCLPC